MEPYVHNTEIQLKFIVSKEGNEIVCSCLKNSFGGILCCHVLCFCQRKRIDLNWILMNQTSSRWLKDRNQMHKF